MGWLYVPASEGSSSDSDSPSPERRSLNPRFVEWLMGFPLGWTALDPLGMAWLDWRQRMRSEFLRLG